MQTFLPYPSFYLSLSCLDKKRLNKQCIETLQIINTIENNGKAWSNHPAVLMWKNYLNALKLYYNISVIIWNRQYKKNGDKVKRRQGIEIKGTIVFPPWLGDERLHNSHKSNLLRKDRNFYSKYGWNVPENLDYYWPVKKENLV